VTAPSPATPRTDDDAERLAYERERDRLARETAERLAAHDARVALCEKVEGAPPADAPACRRGRA
jgi:hypothetical protein